MFPLGRSGVLEMVFLPLHNKLAGLLSHVIVL